MKSGSGFLCASCTRFRSWLDPGAPSDPEHGARAFCSAYPDGIPDRIIFSGVDHRHPLGDEQSDDDGNPILYELEPGKEDILRAYEKTVLHGLDAASGPDGTDLKSWSVDVDYSRPWGEEGREDVESPRSRRPSSSDFTAAPVNIDAAPTNADWAKRSWDLPGDLEGFRAFLKSSGMSLVDFMTLPVARAMPDGLRELLGLETES